MAPSWCKGQRLALVRVRATRPPHLGEVSLEGCQTSQGLMTSQKMSGVSLGFLWRTTFQRGKNHKGIPVQLSVFSIHTLGAVPTQRAPLQVQGYPQAVPVGHLT